MSDSHSYARLLLLIAAVGIAAVLSNRLTERLRVPAPALVLVAAAMAVKAVPALHAPPERIVERLVTVALMCILFDGGMSIGWPGSARPPDRSRVVGVVGTFLTAAGPRCSCTWRIGLGWYPALLVATAVAPTDPAVVFSVLGQREIVGPQRHHAGGRVRRQRSGRHRADGEPARSRRPVRCMRSGHVGLEFVLQMVVGAAVGIVGGRRCSGSCGRCRCPGEGLYPLRTMACALALFGLDPLPTARASLRCSSPESCSATSARRTSARSSTSTPRLASLGEIVAFVVARPDRRPGRACPARRLAARPGARRGAGVLIRPSLVGRCLLGPGSPD